MGCSSCTTVKDGTPKGCNSNGGGCSSGCGSKLNVFDWLSNMSLPSGGTKFNIYEVRFKNGRKLFFRNDKALSLSMGDLVAVESVSGYDIGTVSLGGELVRVQMKKKKVAEDSEEVLKIFRKATQKDVDLWESVRSKELEAQSKGRIIISNLGLKMKLSDVEYQGDGKKATFYYTADERVDFRQLIRELASVFSIRIEMKQVGMRQEAARVGGVGSCGRELCCSTWLTDFRKVNTSAARYQQLALNPSKLSGQCGKLKCCLNYELDSYQDALKSFPKQNVVLKTEKGDAVFVKMDIFKKLVWYTYKQNRSKWYKLELAQVHEIIELNKADKLSSCLEDYELDIEGDASLSFEGATGRDSLTRFDVKKPKRNKRRPINDRDKKSKQDVTAFTSSPPEAKAHNKKNRPKSNNHRKHKSKKTVGENVKV